MAKARLRIPMILDDIFKAAIFVKFLMGILETIAGVFFLFVSPDFITRGVSFFLTYELQEDPTDFVAVHLTSLAHSVALSGQLFLALYLLVHGLIKVGLVIALWQREYKIYPFAGMVLALFIVYELLLYQNTHSAAQLFFAGLDFIIILLLRFEYTRLKATHKP